jgi:hypothetical protein
MITREFTEDDLTLSNIAYDAMNGLLDKLDIDEMMVEPFVQFIKGKSGGSIDLLGLSVNRKTLLIADFKFGVVKVNVKESAQLGVYAISSRVDPATKDMWSDVREVVYAIIQPRVRGVVSTYTYAVKDIDNFEKIYVEAMSRHDINPGPHCRYCRAEPYCEEKRAAVVAANLLGARHQDELKAAANIVNEVESWVRSIKAEMYLQMARGVPLTGWKLVEKRPTTKWTDETGAKAFLKSKRIAAKSIVKPAHLMTPIQVGKILRKKGRDLDLSDFTITESSGTTIATEDDSREAVMVSDVRGELKEMMK